MPKAKDVLIVAVGSEPVLPSIPGIEGENVILVDHLRDNWDRVGKKVVILGGGMAGCETAVYLAKEGREVTVVEMLDDVCRDANNRHRPLLLEQLYVHNIRCLTGTKGIEINTKGLVCVNKEGRSSSGGRYNSMRCGQATIGRCCL